MTSPPQSKDSLDDLTPLTRDEVRAAMASAVALLTDLEAQAHDGRLRARLMRERDRLGKALRLLPQLPREGER